MRVLVAEDKPRSAHLLRRALQNQGYSVELVAYDGEEALSIAIARGLDAIVLDVMLPGRDGFDVMRSFRAAKSMVPAIVTRRGPAAYPQQPAIPGLDAESRHPRNPAWGPGSLPHPDGGAEVSDNTGYVFIPSLRSRIATGSEPQFLHTVRGVGDALRVAES
jgi:DNA-binding response OmpR family regulator